MAAGTGRRLERAGRLVRVQAQMRRAAELALAAARDEAAGVEADRARLVAALAESAHGPLLLEAAARRLGGLSARAQALAEAAEERAGDLRARGLAQKRAEAQAARRAAEHRHARERREESARLEGLAPGRREDGDASLP
ncbi:hypothetical protein OPKNFCMD_5605 [Methylobacterium crusticola]|uniref:Flagellar FliJ protein n=1 Tax=Methylobacterium crusticola TaxID=1697972 RepID=A0ABQ4R555_9HYPH|nr:hypothetical protein [Methylobacterium crusticola]GJD52838.1 hypothetical protein OPKNFCMD_5605 [Methylobacterium crusticola]